MQMVGLCFANGRKGILQNDAVLGSNGLFTEVWVMFSLLDSAVDLFGVGKTLSGDVEMRGWATMNSVRSWLVDSGLAFVDMRFGFGGPWHDGSSGCPGLVHCTSASVYNDCEYKPGPDVN